jgi:hypothetical protein
MFEGKKSKEKEGQVGPIDNYVTAMPAEEKNINYLLF